MDDKEYRWKLISGVPNSNIEVSIAEKVGQRLVVTMIRWMPKWNLFDGLPCPEDKLYLYEYAVNEPPSITNRFVRRAILFAMAHGWQPETPQKDMTIYCFDNVLSLEPNGVMEYPPPRKGA